MRKATVFILAYLSSCQSAPVKESTLSVELQDCAGRVSATLVNNSNHYWVIWGFPGNPCEPGYIAEQLSNGAWTALLPFHCGGGFDLYEIAPGENWTFPIAASSSMDTRVTIHAQVISESGVGQPVVVTARLSNQPLQQTRCAGC